MGLRRRSRDRGGEAAGTDRPEDGAFPGEAGSGPAVPRLKRRLAVLALGPLSVLAFQGASLVPWLVEGAYASLLGPALVSLLAAVSGRVGLALVEPVLILLLLLAARALIREVRNARNRGRSPLWGLAGWGLWLGQAASVLTVLFYAVWGLNYARPSLEARLGWEEVREVPVAELTALAREAVDRTNEAYRDLHRSDDAGVPTPRHRSEAQLEEALAAGWDRAASALDLGRHVSRSYGPVKELTLSGLLNELGLFGFYFPFTAEPVTNPRLPGVAAPRSAAHEQAHQRGIGPENEANFLAIMVTLRSPDPHVRYSGWSWVQRRLLTDLSAADREGARALGAGRLPGVRRDEEDLRAFVESLEGPVNEVADRVNDAYLRSHRVEGGIRSYGLVTRLLVSYAREHGGTLRPEA